MINILIEKWARTMIQISSAFPLIGLAQIGNYKFVNLRYDELEIKWFAEIWG